jgi:AraC family transcriptional regulator of adaptative response / DNA-3-methyladenine glycosylase II
LINEGALDKSTVADFAERLGIGERHLRRLFQDHVGASPLQVARAHRVMLAKRLITDTRMCMTEIAHEAGFSSIRQFNDTFRRLYDRSPSAIRESGKLKQ